MGDFDSLLQVVLGGASFTATDYAPSSKPVVKDGLLQTGMSVSVSINGYVEGSTPAEFAANLSALRAALENPGSSLTVYGLSGEKEYELLAPQCIAGPFITYTQKEGRGGSALHRDFTITLDAEKGLLDPPSESNPNGVRDSRHVQVVQGPDSLRGIQMIGEVNGPGARGYFDGAVIDQVRQIYPWPDWVISRRSDGNPADNKLSYTITVAENRSPLPGDAAANAYAVDGSSSLRVERDEQMRQTRTLSFDLVVIGDPQKIISIIRPNGQAILRESLEITSIKEQRLRASYVLLEGGNGNDLLDWSQSIQYQGAAPLARPVRFEGVGTILVVEADSEYRLSITGRAVGVNNYPKAPDPPAIVGYLHADRPTIKQQPLDGIERETTWTYNMIGSAAIPAGVIPTLLAAIGRPAAPNFLPKG